MGQNELAAQPQFELLSWTFSLDIDWPNLIPHHHSEVDWIEFSESIGLVCRISTKRSSIGVDSVKVSGVFLLIGIGSWLCCKLIKLYHTTVNNRSGPSSESQGKFGSIFKTCYFGPVNSENDASNNGAEKESLRELGLPEPADTFSFTPMPVRKNVKCKSETGSCLVKSSPIRRLYSTNSSPILNGKDRLDYDLSSVSLPQETSSDNISELSFDIDNTTFARLDLLQQEIDQIKTSCLSMDEEFVTIKGTRNLPGLSNLMEASELNEDQRTEEQIQKARKCFKGLYSLTTINQSISLELANYQASPTEEIKEDLKGTQSVDEENLPSLEWDELEDISDRNIKDETNVVSCDSMMVDHDSLQSSQMAESWSNSDFNKEEMSIDRSPSFESGNWSSYSISEMQLSDNDVINIGSKVDIVSYALSEWKGTSPRAETIRKGYSEVASSLGLKNLQRIRGDNYCAIRATLFQVLTQDILVPSAEQVYNILCQGSSKTLLKHWRFTRLPYSNNVMEGIKTCLLGFDQLVAAIANMEDKAATLEKILNADSTLDLQLNEAVKLMMLERTIYLYESMNNGGDVPLFAVLMFARDSCVSISDFMNNHLCRVGDSGGLEMVEMYLLGYTLNVTLRVVRPSAFGTEDFICFYPEEDITTRPQVTLIAEDDRHYNILVK